MVGTRFPSAWPGPTSTTTATSTWWWAPPPDSLRPVNGDKGPDAVLSLSRSFVPFDKFVDGRGKVRIKVRPVVR